MAQLRPEHYSEVMNVKRFLKYYKYEIDHTFATDKYIKSTLLRDHLIENFLWKEQLYRGKKRDLSTSQLDARYFIKTLEKEICDYEMHIHQLDYFKKVPDGEFERAFSRMTKSFTI